MQTNNKNSPQKNIIHAYDFMPKDKYSLDILHQRAKILSQQKITHSESINNVDYIRFKLGKNEFYGIPFHHTKEVMENVRLTPLPCSSEYVAGVINRRGTLLTLIDLKKFFGLNQKITKEQVYLIVVEANGISVGIIADQIENSDAYDSKKLNGETLNEGVIDPKYVIGLHRGNTAILNIEAIITTLKLQLKP